MQETLASSLHMCYLLAQKCSSGNCLDNDNPFPRSFFSHARSCSRRLRLSGYLHSYDFATFFLKAPKVLNGSARRDFSVTISGTQLVFPFVLTMPQKDEQLPSDLSSGRQRSAMGKSRKDNHSCW